MDKSTLSNYGWVVCVILVLAIMISLATPFGSVIRNGVAKTVESFKGDAEGVLDNMGGATSFDDLGGGAGGADGGEVVDSKIIPEGGIYRSGETTYVAGDEFPETPVAGDVYTYKDYEYRYKYRFAGYLAWEQKDADGWGVIYTGSDAAPSDISPVIAGRPVDSVSYAFAGSQTLVTAPRIPNTVTDMEGAFLECSSLKTAPVIPNGVTNMLGAFCGCTDLTTAPDIPDGVQDLNSAFYNCTSLTTAPAIPSSANDLRNVFDGCTSITEPIKLSCVQESYLLVDTWTYCPPIEVVGCGVDENADLHCDLCGCALEHVCKDHDVNGDYRCDACNEIVPHVCAECDTNRDYYCDACFSSIPHVCAEHDNGNYTCEICYSILPHTCVEYYDGTCYYCGQPIS